MDNLSPVERVTRPNLETATQVFAIAALLILLKLGLLTALLAGLLINHLVHLVAPALLHVGVKPTIRKTAALTILVSALALLIAFASFKLINLLLTGGIEGLVEMLQRMAEVIETLRIRLPDWVQPYVPDNAAEIERVVSNWLRGHASQFGAYGQEAVRFLFHLIIGLVVGSLIAVQTTTRNVEGPLSEALERRVTVLSGAFRNIVFSQIRISALNTTLTAIYLALVLPAFDVHLPFVKTMIAVTFIAGLLPVLGNLISNTVIFLVSLSVSPWVAVAALAYLIIIHKLEYFFNARIIGSRIRARAWELLTAMLVMEAAFGLPGLVAGPIYYAYLKDELKARGML